MRQLLCTVVALLAGVTAMAMEPSLVTDKELSLGGIAIGDTRATVLRKLGQPRRMMDTGDFLNIRMDYPGITVWFGEGNRVGEVLSTSKQHCTPTGVCPGVPFAKVEATYGTPLVTNRKDGTYMEYPSSQSPCWLQIAVSSGSVTSVRAECQP